VTLQWFFLGDFSQVKNFLKTTLDPTTRGNGGHQQPDERTHHTATACGRYRALNAAGCE
jgi:hypothetical protein